MLRDLFAWLIYSPRRLVTSVGLGVGIGVIMWTGLAPEHEAPTRPQSSVQTPGRAEAPAPPSTPTTQDQAAAVRAVLSAARAFLAHYVVSPDGPVPNTVPTRLRTASTPALWDGLRLTQPQELPRGPVRTVTPDDVGPYGGTVLVELDGPDLTLSVVAWERGWRVSDVRPAEGL